MSIYELPAYLQFIKDISKELSIVYGSFAQLKAAGSKVIEYRIASRVDVEEIKGYNLLASYDHQPLQEAFEKLSPYFLARNYSKIDVGCAPQTLQALCVSKHGLNDLTAGQAISLHFIQVSDSNNNKSSRFDSGVSKRLDLSAQGERDFKVYQEIRKQLQSILTRVQAIKPEQKLKILMQCSGDEAQLRYIKSLNESPKVQFLNKWPIITSYPVIKFHCSDFKTFTNVVNYEFELCKQAQPTKENKEKDNKGEAKASTTRQESSKSCEMRLLLQNSFNAQQRPPARQLSSERYSW
ncbi:MAG: hypothetical protein ACOYK8_09685 [Alphaproteobacteria bacterium]